MFRISHVLGSHREHDRRCIAEIQVLFDAAFPDLAREGDYVARKFLDQSSRGYPSILLAAHGAGDRVVGFALADYFESIGYAYLDFIVAKAGPSRSRTGRGALRGLARGPDRAGANGLFLEAPTDDPDQVTDPTTLKANKTRLKFYERYGVFPVVGTLYDQPVRPGNPVEPRLLYDPLGNKEPLDAEGLRNVIRTILTQRYSYRPDDPYVVQLVDSVQ